MPFIFGLSKTTKNKSVTDALNNVFIYYVVSMCGTLPTVITHSYFQGHGVFDTTLLCAYVK